MRRLVPVLCLIAPAAWGECLTLGELGYVLPLDPPYQLFGRELDVTLDLTAAGLPFAEVSFFAFPALDSFEPTLPNSKTLPNGLKLHYSTLVSELGGNAAPLATLAGWLEGDVRMGVSCISQQESPNPEWCLPILGRLRPETDGCEKNKD